ncbi:MAG: hypothetical protein ACYTF9_07560 [Planctomycetota bacterium]|jgi:hypothetical protein
MALLLGGAWMCTAGCEPYRIEYRERPSYYDDAVDGDLPDREVLDDGTVVVYRKRDESDLARKGEAKDFLIREEFEGGRVVLRGFLPEHVLANTLTCLQNEEYELMWEQLVAEQTRAAYRNQGKGQEEFAAFFAKRRRDIAATVNRMLLGIPRNEVVSDNLGGGMIQLRFVPQVAGQFKFRTITMGSSANGLKLVMIR